MSIMVTDCPECGEVVYFATDVNRIMCQCGETVVVHP